MTTVPTRTSAPAGADYYPDSDGLPMGETPLHGKNLAYLVQMLDAWFEDDPRVYVAGNMFVYYVRGDRNRHVSPDVFVVRGIPKSTDLLRRRYLVWEEGKAPDVVIELTSASTREEDLDDKMAIYQDTLRVPEYFLFDPYAEYLDPPFQGYRLTEGRYQPIAEVDGRLPSEVLGLHLGAHDHYLRVYDPAARRRLPLPPEERQLRLQAEQTREEERRRRQEAEAEVERLRQELEDLRRRTAEQSGNGPGA